MPYSTQDTLCFPPVKGLTVRGQFDGGALSSDFGPMILRGWLHRVLWQSRRGKKLAKQCGRCDDSNRQGRRKVSCRSLAHAGNLFRIAIAIRALSARNRISATWQELTRSHGVA